MTQDPLSIPTTILPQSTFDPVQFAKERRQEILTNQKETRERYNKIWESIGTPSDINESVYMGIMKNRNDIIQRGAEKAASGIDITDISNPKYGKDALQFRNELGQLNSDIDWTIGVDKLIKETGSLMAKDDKNVIDQEATRANIDKIRGMKDIKEIKDFLSSKGDNLIEVKKQPVDLNKGFSTYLKDSGVLPMVTEEESKAGGKLITTKYNEIDPQTLRDRAIAYYNSDPKVQEQIKQERANDPADVRGGSDIDYFMSKYGNQRARQQTYKKSEFETPRGGSGTPAKPKYQVTSEPTETFLGKYKVTGKDVTTYDQSEALSINPGEGVVDIKSGIPVPVLKGAVDFTPINAANYYVLNKDKSGFKKGTILTDTDIQRGTRFKSGDYEVKRFVKGVFDSKETDEYGKAAIKQKTILIPYENIKNELSTIYKDKNVAPPEQPEKEIEKLSSEDKQAYDWAVKNPNDPRAKKILNLLNKK